MIAQLKVNGQMNNIAVDKSPEISWKYAFTKRPLVQESWRVTVQNMDSETVFDSGTIFGRQMSVVLPAEGLRSDERYSVCVCTRAGGKEHSASIQFETALLHPADWHAKWIKGSAVGTKFSAREKPVRAKLFVSGLGYYHCYLNGEKLGDLYAAPAYTNYAKRIEYQIFDVTDCIGMENRLYILLASHFEPGVKDCRYYQGEKMAVCQLHLHYADGSMECIASDEKFLSVAETPYVHTSIYNGETLDMRLADTSFLNKDPEGEQWKKAETAENPVRLFAQNCPGVKIKRERRPVRVYWLGKGRAVYDFGVNITGVLKVTAAGARGARLALRHAELLNGDHTLHCQTARIARAEDVYIFGGEEGKQELQTYIPQFTYHGFRYAEVFYDGADPQSGEVKALEIATAMEETGKFRCGSPFLNRIHKIMKQTLANNLYSVPTDCSQRDERQGWLGDAQIAMPAVLCLWDAKQFYRNYLEEIACGQNEDGSYTQLCAPPFVGGETLLWTGAFYMMADEMWEAYGDLNTIQTYYPALCRFYSSLARHETEKGMDIDNLHVGDWLGQYTSENHSCLAVYCDFAAKLSKFAKILGKSEEEQFYRGEFLRLKDKYNHLYYFTTPDKSGAYGDTNEIGQYMNAVSVCFGLEADGEAEKVAETLAFDVEYSRGTPTLTTGLVGTKYLFQALSKIGRNDLALRLFLKTDYPSWGFMLRKGATTVWERWEYLIGNNMNSHCHSPLASPLSWLYRELCGISVEHGEDGMYIRLQPYYSKEVAFCEGETETCWGKVRLRWEVKGKKRRTIFVIPPNAYAVFHGKKYGNGVFEVEESV